MRSRTLRQLTSFPTIRFCAACWNTSDRTTTPWVHTLEQKVHLKDTSHRYDEAWRPVRSKNFQCLGCGFGSRHTGQASQLPRGTGNTSVKSQALSTAASTSSAVMSGNSMSTIIQEEP